MPKLVSKWYLKDTKWSWETQHEPCTTTGGDWEEEDSEVQFDSNIQVNENYFGDVETFAEWEIVEEEGLKDFWEVVESKV